MIYTYIHTCIYIENPRGFFPESATESLHMQNRMLLYDRVFLRGHTNDLSNGGAKADVFCEIKKVGKLFVIPPTNGLPTPSTHPQKSCCKKIGSSNIL